MLAAVGGALSPGSTLADKIALMAGTTMLRFLEANGSLSAHCQEFQRKSNRYFARVNRRAV
jgi:hypothetical protein